MFLLFRNCLVYVDQLIFNKAEIAVPSPSDCRVPSDGDSERLIEVFSRDCLRAQPKASCKVRQHMQSAFNMAVTLNVSLAVLSGGIVADGSR